MSVELAAACAAAWHTSWLRALGLRSEATARVWRALDEPPFIYWTAITLSEAAGLGELRDRAGTVCDSWSAVDLEPHGFTVWSEEPWFVRPPAPLPDDEPPRELDVLRVSTPAEVEEFELVCVRGFGSEDATIEPGTIHPAAILDDERMTMLTGRVDGAPVAAAMSYRTESAVGIYGVTTVASARGRGYASWLTRSLVDPALPATLSPTAMAEPMYRRLGFDAVGRLTMWSRQR